MFKKVTPESCGIESGRILEFLEYLEDSGLSTHGLLIAKDDKIFAEAYWKPFDADFCHRMYSQTKSYVGVAIGLLEEEGKITVIRPVRPVEVGRMEKDIVKLTALYNEGYKVAGQFVRDFTTEY